MLGQAAYSQKGKKNKKNKKQESTMELKNELDSVSYCFGVNIAENMKGQGC